MQSHAGKHLQAGDVCCRNRAQRVCQAGHFAGGQPDGEALVRQNLLQKRPNIVLLWRTATSSQAVTR